MGYRKIVVTTDNKTVSVDYSWGKGKLWQGV